MSVTTRSGRSGSTQVRSARRFLIPLAVATAGLVAPSPLPAEATPLACDPHCTITASAAAYIAPVTEIASGSSVHWMSIDIGHPTSEQTLLNGGGSGCFHVAASPGVATPPVVFAIAGGGVTADGVPCSSAIGLGDVGFALPYHCTQHPEMQAALIITP